MFPIFMPAKEKIKVVTPIKEIARQNGWNGQKDERSRRYLAELKRVFSEYNDLPTKYSLEEYDLFLNDENDIMLVHIRESDQIDKFIKNLNLQKNSKRRGFL